MRKAKVNPSTPHHKCWGLLRVDPERRFFTPPSKAGLGATEWVNFFKEKGNPNVLQKFDL